jgi:hypothetical protein
MKYTDMIVLFFCVGLIMLLFSIIFFIISIRYKKNQKTNFNVEEEKMEVQAILIDAKDLMRQIDDYSGTVIGKIDEKLSEMKRICQEFQECNINFKEVKKIKKESESDDENIEVKDDKFNEIELKISNSLHRKIIVMYNEGKKIEEISKILSMGKGEVMLIVKKYKNFSSNF